MGKLVLFLLFVLCIGGSLQKAKGKIRTKAKKNNTSFEAPLPRSFFGELDKKASVLNGTLAPSSSHSVPALKSLSNNTVGYLSSPLTTRLIPIVYMLLVAIGVPANVAILYTLGSKIRKVSSAILYCSLALSDLFLLLSLLFKAHYHLYGNNWTLGETACRVVTACFYGNLYCSAQTLACISIKRYLAVVHPFKYKILPKRLCTFWATLSVWVVFGVAVVPEFLVQQSYWLPELHRVTCHDVLPLGEESHKFLLYYNLILTIFGLLVPLVTSVLCFVKIIRELNQSHHDWQLYIASSSLVFVIFLVCFTPAGVLHFLHYVQLFVDRTENLYLYFNLAVCLCCLHACLDPFLFVLMSKSTGSTLYSRTFKGKSLSLSV